jgi:hypothetical protein
MTGSPTLRIGLDNQYQLTEIPGSRPVGLKGYWDTPNTFVLNHILMGDFMESIGRIEFEDNRLTLTIKSLNYGNPPLVIHGRVKK